MYYFHQGHEEYCSQYSLHFFSGLKEPKELSWLSPKKQSLRSERFVLCKVIRVDCLFPSRHEMILTHQYGPDATNVTQTNQLIHQVTLQVVPLTHNSAKSCI